MVSLVRFREGWSMADELGEGLVMLIPDQRAPIGNLRDYVVQTGDHEDTDDGAKQHATDAGRTDRLVSDGSRARGANQRNQADDERERGHHDWPEAQASTLDTRIHDAQALTPPLDGKLDDQNRVLAE